MTALVPLPTEPVKVPDDSVKDVVFVMVTSKNPPKPSDGVRIGIVCPVPVHRRSPPSTSLPMAVLLPRVIVFAEKLWLHERCCVVETAVDVAEKELLTDRADAVTSPSKVGLFFGA